MYQPWGPPPQPWPPPGPPAWGRPTGPSAAWAVLLWCTAGVCLVSTLFFGLIATIGFSLDNHLDNNGVTTSAIVTDVDGSTVTVEFSTEDDDRVTDDFIWWPDEYPTVGDRIKITYDPDDTSYVIQAGSNEDQLIARGFAVAAVLALGTGVAAGAGAGFVHRARTKAARSDGFSY
ncbi:MAG TPA: DUF3592 domain-containing protein [Mycobacterium sp.]|nr:DUF3592 domain-containing protein [Mycobacterium sp.]